MPKVFIYLIIIIPAVLIGLFIALTYFQEKMIFYPEKLTDKYEFNFQNEFKEYNVKMNDGVHLNVLVFEHKNPKGYVFFNHGNAGNLAGWGEHADIFLKNGYTVCMYDYRGFGKSEGKIKSEKQLYNDASQVLKFFKNQYNIKSYVLYGISLGTGIAVKLAEDFPPKLLILETPFYNFYDVAKYHYPYLPTSWILKYHFKTDKLLPKFNFPIYLIHGTEDKVVPYSSSVRLSKLNKNCRLLTLEGGEHSYLYKFPIYESFMKEILE
jgi:hypothetical protein